MKYSIKRCRSEGGEVPVRGGCAEVYSRRKEWETWSFLVNKIKKSTLFLQGLHITVIRLTNPRPSNSRSNWNLEMLIFVKGGKPENPEKTLGARTRTNNKLNPLMTPGPGIEPGPHWWEASAINTAPSLLPRMNQLRGYLLT